MIKVDHISHTYMSGLKQSVLHDISVEFPDGKFIAILGPSGSGKTTFLQIIAGLLCPTEGKVFYNNTSLYEKKMDELCSFRAKNIGFVFQDFFLESSFSAMENVMVSLLLTDLSKDEMRRKALEMLEKVSLLDKQNSKPTELSGGECQRVSIARALANDPPVIIADEPTGNLDSKTGIQIIELLKSQVQNGKMVIMVTHNEKYVEYADLVYRIEDGIIV